jgi:hypothetical protein
VYRRNPFGSAPACRTVVGINLPRGGFHWDWKLVLAGIATVIAVVWVVRSHLGGPRNISPTTTQPRVVSAPQGGIAIGGDVSVAPGGIINTGSNNTFTFGLTREEFAANLKRREQELRLELEQTNQANAEGVALLARQLTDVQVKLRNLEHSFAEARQTYAQAYDSVHKFKNDYFPEQFERAKEGLQQGDATAALTFLSSVAQSSRYSKTAAAEAAYQLGELSYDRSDHLAARQHYRTAVNLQPENANYVRRESRANQEVGQLLRRTADATPGSAVSRPSLDTQPLARNSPVADMSQQSAEPLPGNQSRRDPLQLVEEADVIGSVGVVSDDDRKDCGFDLARDDTRPTNAGTRVVPATENRNCWLARTRAIPFPLASCNQTYTSRFVGQTEYTESVVFEGASQRPNSCDPRAHEQRPVV